MLIGIVPNLLSALLVLGIMGIINLPLDMMTITIAAITVGMLSIIVFITYIVSERSSILVKIMRIQ